MKGDTITFSLARLQHAIRTHRWQPARGPTTVVARIAQQAGTRMGPTTRQPILDALAVQPMSREQVQAAIGGRKDARESMLRKLMEDGLVKYGGFTITSRLRRARVYRLART